MPDTKRRLPVIGEMIWDVVREPDGLLWLVDRGRSQDWVSVIGHEREPPGKSYFDYLCSQFRPGRTFLDVGAHIGMYSIRAAKAGCKVIAVEMNPESSQFLRMNKMLNKLDFDVWAFAAWDEAATLTLTNVPNGIIRSMNATVNGPEHYESLDVLIPALPLSPLLLDQCDRLDVVKLDCEGSDIHVLTGLRDALVKFRPLICWEDHSHYLTYTERDARDFYESMPGYTWHEHADLGILSTENRWRIGVPDGWDNRDGSGC